MKEVMMTGLDAKKFEVVRCTLFSWKDVCQAKVETYHDEWMAAMEAS
jgi:hypothetical protein